jgi:hypothetical protein
MSEDVTIRAARAEQLLEDEVLLEAFHDLSQDVANRVFTTDLKDAAACIAAVAAAQATSNFELQLRAYVTAGKAAERKPYKVA